jgi:hypothetical protein
MTRSALASTFGGIVRPICLAAFRLMTSLNLVDCSEWIETEKKHEEKNHGRCPLITRSALASTFVGIVRTICWAVISIDAFTRFCYIYPKFS